MRVADRASELEQGAVVAGSGVGLVDGHPQAAVAEVQHLRLQGEITDNGVAEQAAVATTDSDVVEFPQVGELLAVLVELSDQGG